MSFFDRQGIPEDLLIDRNRGSASGDDVGDDSDGGSTDSEDVILDNFGEDVGVLQACSMISAEVQGGSFRRCREGHSKCIG